jgi:hypothetical protein
MLLTSIGNWKLIFFAFTLYCKKSIESISHTRYALNTYMHVYWKHNSVAKDTAVTTNQTTTHVSENEKFLKILQIHILILLNSHLFCRHEMNDILYYTSEKKLMKANRISDGSNKLIQLIVFGRRAHENFNYIVIITISFFVCSLT